MAAGYGLIERFQWIGRGFFMNKVELYPFDRYSWRLFLSDRQVLRTSRINGDANLLLEDKLLFQETYGNRLKMPRLFGFKRDSGLQWKNDSTQSLEGLLKAEGKIIVKPIDGVGGGGVYVLESHGGEVLRNDVPISISEAESEIMKTRDIILCEFLEQGAFASSLYPRTVNTIRMMTMLDPDDGEAFVAGAGMRVGQSSSYPVDNVSSGGMFCGIDRDTGKLGKATTMASPPHWMEVHPDTGVKFDILSIPNWSELCAEVLRMANELADIPHVAWDLAILDDGVSVIEANGWSQAALFQVEQPMLLDPRIRKFYKHHAVI